MTRTGQSFNKSVAVIFRLYLAIASLKILTKLLFKLGHFVPRLFSKVLHVAPSLNEPFWNWPSGGSHFYVKEQAKVLASFI